MSNQKQQNRAKLNELIKVFLQLGATSFGGPTAHIALMEEQIVRRRGWLNTDEFLDLLGATQLIPGPNSTELAIHIGYRRGGWVGLIGAGVAFILPATLMVMACAWAYVHFGTKPAALSILYGIKPVIIAVIFQAMWGLGKSAIKTKALFGIGLVALASSLLGVHELLVLGGSGLAVWIFSSLRARLFTADGGGMLVGGSSIAALVGSQAQSVLHATAFSLEHLFWFFAKVGSVLFGSGYVLLAFLRTDLVEKLGWLTEAQLLDALAFGQLTPGPVFTTATFIGYILAGNAGAVVATVGIFLPAFFFVAISAPFLPRLQRSPSLRKFLDGLNVASLALMTVVGFHLARDAIVDLPTTFLGLASLFVLVRYQINSAWLVAGGGILGFILAG